MLSVRLDGLGALRPALLTLRFKTVIAFATHTFAKEIWRRGRCTPAIDGFRKSKRDAPKIWG
jgi:hypothetical protein